MKKNKKFTIDIETEGGPYTYVDGVLATQNGGIKKGELSVFMGQPYVNTGKSQFMVRVMLEALKRGYTVTYQKEI